MHLGCLFIAASIPLCSAIQSLQVLSGSRVNSTSFLDSSTCSYAQRQRIEFSAVEITQMLEATTSRLRVLRKYAARDPVPEPQDPLLDSTLHTYMALWDPNFLQRSRYGYVSSPTKNLKFLDTVLGYFGHMLSRTRDDKFTQVTCGSFWLKQRFLNRFLQGGILRRRVKLLDTRPSAVQAAVRNPRSNVVYLPDLPTGLSNRHYERSSNLIPPGRTLVSTLENLAGQYPVVLALQEAEVVSGRSRTWQRLGWYKERIGPQDVERASIPGAIKPDSLTKLKNYKWPNNTIQLANLVTSHLTPTLFTGLVLSQEWTGNANIDRTAAVFEAPTYFEYRSWGSVDWDDDGFETEELLIDTLFSLYPYKTLTTKFALRMVYTAVALFLDNADWSTGMNRALQPLRGYSSVSVKSYPKYGHFWWAEVHSINQIPTGPTLTLSSSPDSSSTLSTSTIASPNSSTSPKTSPSSSTTASTSST